MDTIERQEGVALAPSSRRARKLRRKRLLWAGLLLCILVGAVAWYRWRAAHAVNPLSDLQTAQVSRTSLVETVSASGSVTSQTGAQVKIGSQVTGRIKRLFADVGGHVQAGQVIAELDLPDTEAQLDQAKAALSSAQVKLEQQISNAGMQHQQTGDAIRTATAAFRAAQARRDSALAAARMQPSQTQSDIQRAVAGLNSANATLNQQQKSHDLQLATAQSAIDQAQANETNDAANLARQQALVSKGFVATSAVDAARAQAAVSRAQLASARKSLDLVSAKADADVQTAQQGVAQAKAALNGAQSERYQNVIKQQDLKDAQAAVRQAQAELSSAQAGLTQNTLRQQDIAQARDAVKQAQQQVKYWQAQLDKTFIRSPISGTVLQMAAQQGETLAAGLSAPTVIIVADLNRLQIDAYVDETDIGKVKLGENATATVDAYPNEKFKGHVDKIASGSTVQQNVITYDVTVAIQDPKHQLKPDMTASVVINVGEHPNVIAVPNEAVKPGPNGSFVWLMHGKNRAPEQRPVETGATDGTNTEIRSGLKEGQTVVLAGWPPPEGMGNLRMTPFGLRPGGGGRSKGGQGKGGQSRGGGGRSRGG